MPQPTDTPEIRVQCTRDARFDAAQRDDAGGIPVVVSTDAQVQMPDCTEVLVHTPDAIDLVRAPLPIVVTHQRGQISVGIVDQLHISGGALRGVARFGQRPEAAGYGVDVASGILRSVSAGYRRVHSRLRRSDGVVVTDRWQPTHVAIVAEPADPGAGFYRADMADHSTLAPDLGADDSQPAAPAAVTHGATMPLPNSGGDAGTNNATGADAGATNGGATNQGGANNAGLSPQGDRHMAAGGASNVPMPQGTPGNPALELERSRRRGIQNICRANNLDDATRDYWIGAGLSLDRVSDDLLQILQERGERNPQTVARLDLSTREVSSYSLARAILAAGTNDWRNAGQELEASREIAQRLNVAPSAHKFYVPFDVQTRAVDVPRRAGQRDLNAAAPTAGGFLVETQNVSFIDLLRARSVAYRMGAQRLGGLRGNVAVPKQSGAASWYWLASETSTISESQQTLGQLALSPKTGGAYTEISRQLLMQSSTSVEAMVTADLGRVGGLGIDAAVLAGTGATGQPLGISNTPGIGAVAGASLAYSGVLEFQTDVATANVIPTAGGYATTPGVAAKLMQRVKFAGTETPLWDGNLWDGRVAGFAAMSSNQMAADTMLFGDWSAVVVAEWGVLEIETNPFANFQAGIIGVRAMVSMDCGLRYPSAFSLATGIS